MRPARARVYCPPGGYRERVAPAAILDVDGTLVDTNYHHAIAWYRAFRAHGITLPLWRLHRHVGIGGDKYDAFLDKLHVRELVDAWTTKDDVEASKPDPDLVNAALEKAGSRATFMVSDT